VPVECGIVKDIKIAEPSKPNENNNSELCKTPDLYDSNILAMSWQPGFCEHPAHPEKKECAKMASGELVVTNITLHGLWPNLKACGKKYANCSNTPLSLSEETISAISPWMPSFYYDAAFGKYEWEKHGTCQTARNSDAYFIHAVAAVKVVDASPIGIKIKNSIGKSVTKNELVDLVKSVHSSAANSVAFLCKGKYLVEIRIRLDKDFPTDGNLKSLFGPTPEPITNVTDECSDGEILIEASGP
jgi:ribonuclease T2